MASRAADLADRQAIWDKCVADGKCKNEEWSKYENDC
jgi:hypothetical protein